MRKSEGRWRPSAEAGKIGTVAMKLEELLHRDHCSLEEAFTILTTNHHLAITKEELEAIADRLPRREFQRLTDAGNEPLDQAVALHGSPDAILAGRAADELRAKIETVLEEIQQTMDAEDRLMLRMRFEDDISVSEISRVLGRDRSHVDRRLKSLMRSFREGMLARGISPDDVRGMLETIEP